MTASGDPITNPQLPGPCCKARDVVHLTIDGEATEQHTRLLENHLTECVACRRYADQMNDVMAGIADLRASTETAPDTESPYPTTTKSDANHRRAPFVRTGIFRAAAVIALLLVGAWWAVERKSDLRVATTSLQSSELLDNEAPSPNHTGYSDTSKDSTRIVSARSETHSFIPVKRETHSAKVKLFFLYQSVNPVSNQ